MLISGKESSGETPQRAAVDDYDSWALITNPRKLPQLRSLNPEEMARD